jgi:glycosyltransferase involved in cell wall biosynthesis
LKVLLTHPGTQYAYALAAALQAEGMLYRFATGIAFGENLQRWLPGKWKRRVVTGVPDGQLYRLPLVEWRALQHMRQGFMPIEVLHRRNLHFQQQLPQKLIQNADLIIGFDTSSWVLANRAKAAGKPFVLDVSIAHPIEKEKIYQSLRKAYPEWQQELTEKPEWHIKLEQAEMEQADCIVAATRFTKSTLVKNGIDAAKIAVNAYGTNLSFFASKWEMPAHDGYAATKAKSNITFCFLGMLTARKGIPWLLKVWPRLRQQFPECRLLLGGYGALPAGFQLPAGVEICGFIEPAQRTAFLQQADVFVFPSFFEGFAQVIIEAMATGLPVITTTPTVGPELIQEGVEGFVVEPGEDEALWSALRFFAAQPEAIAPMGRAARMAVLPYTWQAYGERWKAIATRVLQG